VAIGLVANACFVWITDIRLERQLAAIRAAGDPVSLTDLARKPIPPEKNAATYLRQAEAEVRAINDEVYSNDSFASWVKRWEPGHLMPPEGLKLVKKSLESHPKVIPLLERAAACPDYDAQLDYTHTTEDFLKDLLPRAQGFRAFVRVAEWRAHLLISEGKRDDAVRSALLLFRLADHFNRNPTLVAFLVAITVRGIAIHTIKLSLQNGPVATKVRAALDAELAHQERMEGLAGMLKSTLPDTLEDIDRLPGRRFWFISRGVRNMQESAYLKVFSKLTALGGDSASSGKFEQTLAEGKKLGLDPQLCPSFNGTYQAITRARAEIRCLRVLNALQDRVPAGSEAAVKLSELGLPAETITDPFIATGDPLHVKKLPQGWLVYSVGPNSRDDGGKLSAGNDGDVGVGPPPSATGSASASGGTSQKTTPSEKP
jgi:hypothetical protein